jgi:hypothetical protein
MRRYWKSEQGEREIDDLRSRFPQFTFTDAGESQHPVVSGVFEATAGACYTIRLVLPPKYPKDVPMLYCNKDEIPWEGKRHVFVDTGAACLCAQSEYRIHWPHGAGLVAFIDKLVIPYLVCQFYYQVHGVWPPTGQRTHGPRGILEAYADIASPLADTSLPTIRNLMFLLSREREPQGHELCPCGNGKILRKCHGMIVRGLRTQVQKEHARADYVSLFGSKPPVFSPVRRRTR